MAQQHSNWSVFFDQYFHPSTIGREREKNDEEQIHHYYLSCVQIQKGWKTAALYGVHSAFSPLTLHLHDRVLEGSASYLTFYRQDLLY